MSREDLHPREHGTASAGPAAPPSKGTRPHRRSAGRVALIVLLVLLGLAVLVQLVASPIATHLVNKKISSLPEYDGSVRTVKVQLWKLGAEIDDIVLYPRNGDKDPPLVRVKQAALRVAFSGLLRGRLGGELTFDHAEINIIKTKRYENPSDAAEEAKDKARDIEAKLEPWRDALQKAFPLELTRLEVNEAKLRFIDRTYSPNVDLALDHVKIVGSGLSNRPDGEALPAKLQLDGVTTGGGKLALGIQADPLAKTPTFKTTMELKELSLPACNSLLLAYAEVNVTSGSFEIFIEAQGKNGGYNGYVKPFFKDVDFKPTKKADVVKKLAATAADAVMSVLKNDEKDQVATKAPFSGTFNQNDVDVWTTVEFLLRNAFVQALREGFEGAGPSQGGG
jgi:hypothetical protein